MLFGVVVQDAMKRVAVFGNAGGGKSTLARQLAEITRLPLYVLDKLQFREGGAAVPHDEYLQLHRDLLAHETWVIDGYGDDTTIWERLSAADTLVHVDLPLPLHYWRVTKRLIRDLLADPEGWPKDSPLWSSTISSYKTIPLCHRYMTPDTANLSSKWPRRSASLTLGRHVKWRRSWMTSETSSVLVRPGLDTVDAHSVRSPAPPAARRGGRCERE